MRSFMSVTHISRRRAGWRRLQFCLWLSTSLALAVLLSKPAAALQTGTGKSLRVEGVVNDQNGAPVAGASVTLKGNDFSATTLTSGDCRLAFDGFSAAGGAVSGPARGLA